jgi:hypothetical protein
MLPQSIHMLWLLSHSMSSTLNRGLNVKRTKHAICAFVTCAVMVALTGCGDSKQITEVKALPFGDANMTVAQALDNRKVCDPTWTASQDDHNRTVVEYDCNYKGIDDSMFVKNGGMDIVSGGDTWQWTYGPDGTPSLTGVGLVIHHKGGTATTTNYGAIMVEALSKLIVDNEVKTFDQAYSWLTSSGIPGPPEATKSVSSIPDATYGNKLAPFFPGQPAKDALVHAYLQKGLPESSISQYGIDSLGYLQLVDTAEARAAAYPVDPSDVQFALTMKPPTATGVGIGAPHGLQDDKLICLSEVCYNGSGFLVGKAPPEVVAKEVGGATIDGFGDIQPAAQTQQAAQQAAPPASLGQAQGTQSNAPASASTAGDDLSTGSSDEAVPAMTPCTQKLDDAFVKDAQAHGTSEGVSDDMVREWANTCKTLGQ